jgi:segregation and condensation protein B
MSTEPDRLSSILESLLLVADRPLSAREIRELLGETDAAAVDEALSSLVARYDGRGIQLAEISGGWQLRTHPDNAAYVQRLLAGRPARLSRAALETLAIVAYRQPITRAEIDEIRGVDSGGVLHALLGRNLLRILGKKEEPGRPLLYGTSQTFLTFFQLRDLRELPTLREFAELSEESRARLDQAAPEAGAGDEAPRDAGIAAGVDAAADVEPAEGDAPTADAE